MANIETLDWEFDSDTCPTTPLACVLSDVTHNASGFVGSYCWVIYHQTPAWAALCEWLRAQGHDPLWIPSGKGIIRDQFKHTLTYDLIRRDQDGRAIFTEDQTAFISDTVVDQHEAGPPPLPIEITGAKL